MFIEIRIKQTRFKMYICIRWTSLVILGFLCMSSFCLHWTPPRWQTCTSFLQNYHSWQQRNGILSRCKLLPKSLRGDHMSPLQLLVQQYSDLGKISKILGSCHNKILRPACIRCSKYKLFGSRSVDGPSNQLVFHPAGLGVWR